MSLLTIKILILAAGVILTAAGFTLNHFRIGNKDVRYLFTSCPKRKQRRKARCTTVCRKRSQKLTQKSRIIMQEFYP